MFPSRLSLSHSLNDEVSTIIYQSKEWSTRRWILFQLVFYLIYIARFTFIFYRIVHPSSLYLPSEMDFFEHALRYLSTDRDYFFSLTYISLFLFAFAMTYCLYLTPNDTVTWLIYDDLVLKLGDAYRESGESPKRMRLIWRRHSILAGQRLGRLRRLLPPLVRHKLEAVIVKWTIWWAFDHIKKRRLRRLEMHYFPKVQLIVKIRILQMAAVCDQFNRALLLMICKLTHLTFYFQRFPD